MLTPPSRNSAWRLLRELQLLPIIFRDLPAGCGTEIFAHLPKDQAVSFGLALAAATLSLQSDPQCLVGVDQTAQRHAARKVRLLLKISNNELEAMTATLEQASILLRPTTLARRMRFMASAYAAETRTLLAAMASAGFFADHIALLDLHLASLQQIDCAPPPLITGDDLTAAGYRPGPKFKGVLEAVYDAQLERRVTDYPSAIEFARKLLDQ